jgi:hypothetical protein
MVKSEEMAALMIRRNATSAPCSTGQLNDIS